MVIAFVLIWLLLLHYVISGAAEWMSVGGSGLLASTLFNSRLIQSLLNWEIPEFAVFWVIALYTFPLMSIVLAADQTASDRSRGTLRLLSLHATRSTIFFGRFAGLVCVQSLLLAIVVAATLLLAVLRDQTLLLQAINTGAMVFANLFLLISAYTAAMAVISLFAGSARQATTWATILWIVITVLLSWLARRYPETANLRWLMPGAHISSLLHHNSWQAMQLAIVPVCQTALLLTSGWFVMKKRDL